MHKKSLIIIIKRPRVEKIIDIKFITERRRFLFGGKREEYSEEIIKYYMKLWVEVVSSWVEYHRIIT